MSLFFWLFGGNIQLHPAFFFFDPVAALFLRRVSPVLAGCLQQAADDPGTPAENNGGAGSL